MSVNRIASKSAILASFKVDLMHGKKVWVTCNDDGKCVIFWSSVNLKTGRMERNSFTSTTFYKAIENRHECSNCPIYRHTGLNGDCESASCPHVCLRNEVLAAVTSVSTGNGDDFVKFLRIRLAESVQVNIVSSTDKRLMLLVIADEDRCRSCNVRSRESLVSIWRPGNSSDGVIQCHNVECRKKKIIKKLKSPMNYCPHFEKVWATSSIVDMIHKVIHLDGQSVQWGVNNATVNSHENDCPELEGFVPIGDESFVNPEPTRQTPPTSSVKYDLNRRRFVPTVGVVTPIPLTITDEVERWSVRRKLGIDVHRDANGMLMWNSDGYLSGTVSCEPEGVNSSCPSCTKGVLQRKQIQDFKLHSSIGCVIRKRYAAKCSEEGNVM